MAEAEARAEAAARAAAAAAGGEAEAEALALALAEATAARAAAAAAAEDALVAATAEAKAAAEAAAAARAAEAAAEEEKAAAAAAAGAATAATAAAAEEEAARARAAAGWLGPASGAPRSEEERRRLEAEIGRHKALWLRRREDRLSELSAQSVEAQARRRHLEAQLASKAQEAALLAAGLKRALAALAAPPGPARERLLSADTSHFELVHVLADLGADLGRGDRGADRDRAGDRAGGEEELAGSLVRFRGALHQLRPTRAAFAAQAAKLPDFHLRLGAVAAALEAREAGAPYAKPSSQARHSALSPAQGRGAWAADVGGYLHPHAPHPPSSCLTSHLTSVASTPRRARSPAASAHAPPRADPQRRPQSGRRPVAPRPTSASVAGHHAGPPPRGRPQSARAPRRGEAPAVYPSMYPGAAGRGPNAYLDAALEASSLALDGGSFGGNI